MMNEQQLMQYFETHKLSQRARDYICDVRANEPARLVGVNSQSNVCTWLASNKMGHQVQTESRTVEKAFATSFEYSHDVIEYWDQTMAVPIKCTNKNGRSYTRWYTADFLLLHDTGPRIIETKTEKELHRLTKKNPSDWKCIGSEYFFRPAMASFAEIGIQYVTLSSAEINPVHIANLRLLLRARYSEISADKKFVEKIRKKLSAHAWGKLSDIADLLGLVDLTPLLKCIDGGLLFADIDNRFLSQPDTVWVALSPELLALCIEDESHQNELTSAVGAFDTVSLSTVPTASNAEKAINKLKRMQSGESSRSVRRWQKKIEEGLKTGLNEFQSLLDNNIRKGNRTQRLNDDVSKFLDWHIKNEYGNKDNLTVYTAHKNYEVLALKKYPFYPPVSRTTYMARVHRSRDDLDRKRGGRRAANAAKSPSRVEDRAIAASLPFELAAIDHYNADIFCVLVSPKGIVYVARPWVTAMVDICTKAILAFWVGFRCPSSRSCSMVIRQCVRRHQKLPAEIIVDRGTDFTSTYFQAMMAHLKVDFSLRPAENPRFGSEVERLFGAMKTQCLAMRPGNLVNYKAVRAISGSFSPDKHAVLTIEQLLEELSIFSNWKNSNISGNQLYSPGELIEHGISRFSCMPVPAKEDKEFIVATAVNADKYTVDFRRGVHINGLHYWHPALVKAKPKKKDLEVRFEPENPYQIYCRIGENWVVCSATKLTSFNRKDPVARLAEAVRILDGRTARDLAKKEADHDLIRKLIEMEHPMSAQKVVVMQNDYIEEYDDSLFSASSSVEVRRLQVSEWSK